MAYFKNKKFTRRNFECTNIVACEGPQAPNENYIPADKSIIEGLTPLWIENGVHYYGHM